MNRFLQNVVDKAAEIMSWEPVKVKLSRVTHADDLNRQMAKLQLMMGQQVSQTTGMKSVGLDFEEETRRKLEEEQFLAEETAEMQERMQQAAAMDEMAPPPQAGGMGGGMMGGGMMGGGMGGGMGMPPGAPPAGGAPPASAGGAAAQQFAMSQPTQMNKPTTPEEMVAQAQTIAQQMMALPSSQRRSELITLKRVDPTMHSLVTSAMDEIRQQARSMGQQQQLQQQFGQM